MEYVIVGMVVVLAAAAVAYSLYKSAVGKGGCAGCPSSEECNPAEDTDPRQGREVRKTETGA